MRKMRKHLFVRLCFTFTYSLILLLLTIRFVSLGNQSTKPILAFSFAPSKGNWQGNTSEGYSISFTVNETRTHVTPFEISYDERCGTLIRPAIFSSITLGNAPGTPIVDDTFIIDGFGKVFTGTFTSAITGTGDYYVYYYDETLQSLCRASGTWIVISQLGSTKIFLPIVLNNSASFHAERRNK